MPKRSGIDVIDLTNEDIYRRLTEAGVGPKVAMLLVEMHEETRALQLVVNELLKAQHGIVEALQLVNAGFKRNSDKLHDIEKRFGDQNKDLVLASKQREQDD